MDEKNKRWYKVTVTVFTVDDKKVKEEYLVNASSLSDIDAQVAEYMKTSQYEFTADGAQATKILDIIGYEGKD